MVAAAGAPRELVISGSFPWTRGSSWIAGPSNAAWSPGGEPDGARDRERNLRVPAPSARTTGTSHRGASTHVRHDTDGRAAPPAMVPDHVEDSAWVRPGWAGI